MRRWKKSSMAVGLCLSLVVTMMAQQGLSFQAEAASRMKLTKTKLTLTAGSKKTLKIKNKKAGKKVKWITSKKSVATVSSKGVVRAKKKGSAVITAKIGSKKLKCKLTVKAKAKATSTPKTTVVPVPLQTPAATETAPIISSQPVQTASATEGPSSPVTSQGPVVSTTPEVTPTEVPTMEPTPFVEITPTIEPTPEISTTPEDTIPPVYTPVSGSVPADDITYSQVSGTYSSAFDLQLTSASGSTIYYTTDGSNPALSPTRKTYTGGITIKSRTSDANVLAGISPDFFDTMNYQITADSVTSKCAVPSNSAVDKCTVIKTISQGADGSQSEITTQTYFIGNMSSHIKNIASSVSAAGRNLSVISITTEKDNLFDYETGIYVKGKVFDDSIDKYLENHSNLYEMNPEKDVTSNFKQKGKSWERSCHIDYFESDGTNTTCEFQQDCGMRIQGNYSRENVQKSFRLYAREEYGTKNFKYPFFGDELKDDSGKTMSKFKTLVLRNGGNDAFNYKYKDIFTQSFVHDLDCETLTGRPCVVYLNGEYWGYYVLQDDVTDNFLENRHGVNKDDVIVYKGSDEATYAAYQYKLDEGEFPAGVTDEDYYLKDTLNYLSSKNFADNNVYQEFCNSYVDEQSAVDYFATMVYLNNGYDWPGKNWSIWRTTAIDENNAYADARWRFCLFDLDLTTEPTWSSGGNAWSNNPLPGLIDKSSTNVMKMFFSHMMDNASFRQKFADKMTTLGSDNYLYSKVSAKGTQYKNMYSALFDQFNSRFNSNYAVWTNGDGCHNGNMGFLQKRAGYIPTIISWMNNRYGTSAEATAKPTQSEIPTVSAEPIDGALTWTGSWTRYSSTNTTTSISSGISIERDDNSFIAITVNDWSQFTNPMLRLTVKDYSTDSTFHIWNEDKTIINKYYTQGIEPWASQEIPISVVKGNTFYINVNSATLVQFDIYEGSK